MLVDSENSKTLSTQEINLLRARLVNLKAEHKRAKSLVAAKKVQILGIFGKTGSPYSVFFSPDLLLGITLSGQSLLLSLIYELSFHPEIQVLSANTDGIVVRYPKCLRDKLLRKVSEYSVSTGFEFEETRYSKIAMRDVNNYINIVAEGDATIMSPDGQITFNYMKGGKVKRKGLFAEASLMKNPTMQVCSNLAADYLKSGVHPRDNLRNYTDVADYVTIRSVKGGAIQYDNVVEVDDWVCVKDLGTKDNEWMRQAWLDSGEQRAPVKRKSRPAPVKVGVGGVNVGRVARWYMKAGSTTPINYVGSGNRVPKTDGAKVCMTLPDALPEDIDIDWYVNEAISILGDLGVDTSKLTT